MLTKRRVILAVALVLAGYLGLAGWHAAQAISLAGQVQRLADGAAGGSSGTAAETLGRMRALTAGLRSEAGSLQAILWPVRLLCTASAVLPGVGPDVAAFPALLDAGVLALDGANATLGAAQRTLQGPAGAGPQVLVAALGAESGSFETAAAAFAAAQAGLERVQAGPPLTDTVAGLVDKGVTLTRMGRGAGLLLARLPQVLGTPGRRTYLLLGQDDDEIRGTGGFVGTAGVLVVQNGEVVELDYRDAYDFDSRNPALVLAPPAPLAKAMGLELWRLRDSNWFADFAASAQVGQKLLASETGKDVQGVMAFDKSFIEEVLRAWGPVELPAFGVTVTAGNIRRLIEQYTYGDQAGVLRDPLHKEFTGQLAAQLMARAKTAGPNDLLALASGAARALAEKHLLLYLNDTATQEAVRLLRWSGEVLAYPGDDALMLAETNVGYSKNTKAVQRRAQYTVHTDSRGRPVTATLDVEYTNTRTVDTGPCELDVIDTTYRLDKACYKSYVRAYVPKGARPVASSGFARGLDWYEEGDATVLGGFMVLPAQGVQHITIGYALPRSVTSASGRYVLRVQSQPAAPTYPLTVTVDGSITTVTVDRDLLLRLHLP